MSAAMRGGGGFYWPRLMSDARYAPGPVCTEVFKDPVLLSCSHSFCTACVYDWWRNKNKMECPLCKEIHPTGQPPPLNLALRNLCEAFLKERERRQVAPKHKRTSEDLCGLHAEKHKLFCLECGETVCVVCLHSEKHAGHIFKPIDEVALEHKEKVQKSLRALQQRIKLLWKAKTKSERVADHCAYQLQQTKKQIREHFVKLHRFLQLEEERRIDALCEEGRQKIEVINEKIAILDRDISALADNIRAVEEELSAEPVSFLQNYKTTVERVQQQLALPDAPPASGTLVDVAKHLGNLSYRVWDKMKDVVTYSPVVLDPNTADSLYTLSNDLTGARVVDRQRPTDSSSPFASEFDRKPFILASEGFDSGTHSWDVEVGDSASFALGVAQRRGNRQGSHWGIRLLNHSLLARFIPGPDHNISARCSRLLDLPEQPRRIRVQLDWNDRRLSFSDPDTNTHIHTFKDIHAPTVTEALFPFIATGDAPLKILPGKMSGPVEQCS